MSDTQLQIVTRASGEEMEQYARTISAIAKETAQSTKDLIEAIATYAQLGYTADECVVLAKYGVYVPYYLEGEP